WLCENLLAETDCLARQLEARIGDNTAAGSQMLLECVAGRRVEGDVVLHAEFVLAAVVDKAIVITAIQERSDSLRVFEGKINQDAFTIACHILMSGFHNGWRNRLLKMVPVQAQAVI